MFPSVYDNKVLASLADSFSRTDLGTIYDKCVAEEKFKNAGARISYDLENGFTNYNGVGLHSHDHEAAFDAYMTGYAFATILKYKENDKGGHSKGGYHNKLKATASKEKP